MNRLSQLDGIRGLAVTAVVLHHLISILGVGVGKSLFVTVPFRIFHVGWMGVDVFFVLSGFLITGIIRNDRSNPDFWGSFYMRRGFRILPAFIVVFVITLAAAHFLVPERQASSGYILAALFFMANWTIVNASEMALLNHLWSLAVEEQFYFLWPQAAKRLKSATIFKLTLFLAAGSELLRIILAALHTNAYVLYKITPTHIDGLSIGAALAIGITLPTVRRLLSDWWRQVALAAVASLLAAFLAMGGSLFTFNVWSQVLAIPPAIVLTAMLIYGSVESSLPVALARFLGSRVMVYLGRRSYALYLVHAPIGVAVFESRTRGHLQHLPQGIAVNAFLIVSAIAVSLFLAEASWRLVESPAQELRRRWMRSAEDGKAHPVEEAVIVQLAEETRLPARSVHDA